MNPLLWIERALGLVPGWCWALAVAALATFCVRLDVGMAHARADADSARAQLLKEQLATASAIGVEKDRAAARVRDLTKTVMETQDELAKTRADAAVRSADFDGRLRRIARPLSCGPAAVGPATPASGGDGQPGAGLPAVAGADFVVLDGQAVSELARFAVESNGVGETLKACRVLLRKAWRGSD